MKDNRIVYYTDITLMSVFGSSVSARKPAVTLHPIEYFRVYIVIITHNMISIQAPSVVVISFSAINRTISCKGECPQDHRDPVILTAT